jgi:hypothetical protein
MKKYGPLLTLLAVALLGGGLFAAAAVNNPAAQPTAPAAPPAAAPADVPPPAAPAAAPPVVAEKAYTGRSSGDEVTVAIAVKDGRAVGYVCDGKKIEAWLEGTLTGDTLSLSGKTSSITATMDEKATLGMITVDGKEWPFSAKGVVSPAGLYEGRGTLAGVATRVGWIVDDKGNVTGVQSGNGTREPAPPLDPANPGATTIDGTPVAVTAIAGDATVVPK